MQLKSSTYINIDIVFAKPLHITHFHFKLIILHTKNLKLELVETRIMSSNYLNGTPLGTLYTVFGVNGDKELCARMTTIGIVYTVVVGLYSVFKPAPYGRYAKTNYGPTVNAKIGWIVSLQNNLMFFFLFDGKQTEIIQL